MLMAWSWHWIRAWRVDFEERRKDIFLRIAFATRYGHCSYSEAMEMPLSDLGDYCKALGQILREERPVEGG